jgi:hypothetical protein
VKLETIEMLEKILFTAKVHFRLWEELQKRRDEKNVKIANSGYGTFIEYTRHAHFKSFIVELHKLVETRKDTHNLSLLFRETKKDENASQEIIKQCDRFLENFENTKKGLFVLRNEVEAHCVKKRSPDESFKAAAISPKEIHDFMRASASLLNELGSHFFKTQWAFNEIEEGESVKKIFEAMESYAIS